MNIRRCSIRVRRTICLEQLLRWLLFVAFLLVSSFIPFSKANAINKNSQTPSKSESHYDDSLQSYLTNFGYLPKDNPEMSNLRTDDYVKRAIGRMQKFAGLQPTGVLDQDTKQLMRTKRCGLPDVKFDVSHRRRRYAVHGSKWPKHDLTYRGQHGDSYPFDGPNVVLAHAFFPAQGLGGDVHFDNDEKWTDRPEEIDDVNSINLLATAAHELGHSLGLGHSKVKDSLMYPYYKSGVQTVKLTYDDVLGVQKLYGVGSIGAPTSPAPTVPTTTEFWARGIDNGPPSDPNVPISIPKTTPMPHPCDTHIDAVSRLRSEIFVFKDRYYWRFDGKGQLVESPALIEQFWYGLPSNLTQIDAIYERADRDRVKIFIGRTFYEFSANHLIGRPRNIKELGLPDYVKHIDAAFVWEYNGKTYFFVGDEYWRFDEDLQSVELNYPRKMAIWENVPTNVDAAFTDKTGTTYFFKNEMIYKFNDYFMRVEKTYPKRINSFWGHCLDNTVQQLIQNTNVAPKLNAGFLISLCLFFLLFFALFI